MSPTSSRRLGFVPIVMSLMAMAVVVFAFAGVIHEPQQDEGAGAHLFQILMAAQLPLILWFMLGTRRPFRAVLPMFGAQLLCFGLALLSLRMLIG